MNQWLTMSEAARLVGRVPGGNIHRLMVKWGVDMKLRNGFVNYYAPDVRQKVPHLHRTATEQARNELIDRETKGQAELPLTTPPPVKPVEKSIAEKLDGVHYSMYELKRNLDGGREFVHLTVNNAILWAFDPYAIAQLAREIVRRIDGEPVKQAEEKTITPPDGMIAVCRQVITQIDGCDYRDKYNELVEQLKKMAKG